MTLVDQIIGAETGGAANNSSIQSQSGPTVTPGNDPLAQFAEPRGAADILNAEPAPMSFGGEARRRTGLRGCRSTSLPMPHCGRGQKTIATERSRTAQMTRREIANAYPNSSGVFEEREDALSPGHDKLKVRPVRQQEHRWRRR